MDLASRQTIPRSKPQTHKESIQVRTYYSYKFSKNYKLKSHSTQLVTYFSSSINKSFNDIRIISNLKKAIQAYHVTEPNLLETPL